MKKVNKDLILREEEESDSENLGIEDSVTFLPFLYTDQKRT